MVRISETLAAFHVNNCALLSLETLRVFNIRETIARLAERESLTERETDNATREALQAIRKQGKGESLTCD